MVVFLDYVYDGVIKNITVFFIMIIVILWYITIKWVCWNVLIFHKIYFFLSFLLACLFICLFVLGWNVAWTCDIDPQINISISVCRHCISNIFIL